MAQNITLMGASYTAVPAVTLPKTGGGTASFTDVTDTTAAAADVASGKYFYTAAGVRTQGTGSGGGGDEWTVTEVFSDGFDGNQIAVFYSNEPLTNIGAYILYLKRTISNPLDGDVVAILYDGSAATPIVWAYRNGNASQVGEVPVELVWDEVAGGMELGGDTFHFRTDSDSEYGLLIVHGGSGAFTFRTATYDPPSGVYSAQFSVEEDPPLYFCGLAADVVANQYHRVQTVVKSDDQGIFSGTNFYTSTLGYYDDFTEAYAGGTLTITSSGTNNGGYFHNPETYYLYYALASDFGGPSLQDKTVNPTTSTQEVTADAGYDGLRKVTVSAISPTKAAATYYPSGSDQTISSGQYLTGVQTIKGVTTSNLIAGNIKNGVIVQVGDSVDPDRVLSVTGTYTGGGGGDSKNAQSAQSTSRSTSTTYTEVITLTCTKAGTYDVYWSTFRSSTSGTWGSQLYINDSAYGSAQTGSWSNHIQNIHLSNVQIAANAEVAVRVRSRGSNYYGYVGTLTIIEA